MAYYCYIDSNTGWERSFPKCVFLTSYVSTYRKVNGRSGFTSNIWNNWLELTSKGVQMFYGIIGIITKCLALSGSIPCLVMSAGLRVRNQGPAAWQSAQTADGARLRVARKLSSTVVSTSARRPVSMSVIVALLSAILEISGKYLLLLVLIKIFL